MSRTTDLFLDDLVEDLHIVVYSSICFILFAVASTSASGAVDESGEAGVEVPESVTVEIEEIHPLPEVSTTTTITIIIIETYWLCLSNISE